MHFAATPTPTPTPTPSPTTTATPTARHGVSWFYVSQRIDTA